MTLPSVASFPHEYRPYIQPPIKKQLRINLSIRSLQSPFYPPRTKNPSQLSPLSKPSLTPSPISPRINGEQKKPSRHESPSTPLTHAMVAKRVRAAPLGLQAVHVRVPAPPAAAAHPGAVEVLEAAEARGALRGDDEAAGRPGRGAEGEEEEGMWMTLGQVATMRRVAGSRTA
uniref:Uncharacterized protein n=1 Tax=Bionectria ochroleuca TaxID=29856 RepID=A0A8H7KEB7_BIOOC